MLEPTPCPACAGLSQPGHPAGPLGGWHHLQTCPLLATEDARTVADGDRLAVEGWLFVRESTETERELLAALGWTWPDDPPLQTTVGRLSVAVRSRTWLDATPPITTTEGVAA